MVSEYLSSLGPGWGARSGILPDAWNGQQVARAAGLAGDSALVHSGSGLLLCLTLSTEEAFHLASLLLQLPIALGDTA